MHKLKFYPFWIAILFGIVPGFAIAKTATTTTLKGNLSVGNLNYNGGYFICNVYKQNATMEQAIFKQTYKAKIKDNGFQLEIDLNTSYAYATFSIVSEEGKIFYFDAGNGAEIPYILGQGDNLQLELNSNKTIYFKGEGSDRLNCVQNVHLLKYLPEGASNSIMELYNRQDYKGYYSSSFELFNIQRQMCLSVIDSYKNKLSPFYLSLLKVDIIGKLYEDIFRTIIFTAKVGKNDEISTADNYLALLENNLQILDTGSIATKSISYSNAIYLMESARLHIDARLKSSKPILDSLLNKINIRYQGAFRDKLLLIAISKAISDTELKKSYISSTLQKMADGDIKNRLIELVEKTKRGSTVFPFDLPDVNGTRYKLRDFEGKIVIADFWFNGCHGCLEMPPVLEPVYQKFKMRKDIVWLGINVDGRKQIWLNGVKSGNYTFKGQIELSTWEENGFLHPLVKFFNYNSFPQLLIIDKKGNLVNAFPLDPRTDKGENLTKVINSL